MHKAALLALMAITLCGCSAMQEFTRPDQPPAAYPKKALLIEEPLRMDEQRLNKVFAPDLPKGSPAAREAVKRGVENAEVRTLAEIRDTLEKQAQITIIDNEAVSRVVNELQIDNAHKPVDNETAKKLRAASGADMLLRFRVTDYGLTPVAWQDALIAFEVTSTLGIAAIAYSYPATRALAGVYLVEEGIEETAEAYTGFWALDKVGRPVRIEAEAINLDAGGQIWMGSTTGLSDIRWTRLISEVDATEREAQLDSAVHKAVTNLVGRLQNALRPDN